MRGRIKMLRWEGIALISTLFVLVTLQWPELRRYSQDDTGRGGEGKGKKSVDGLTAAVKALGRKSRKALVGIIVGLLALGVGGGVMVYRRLRNGGNSSQGNYGRADGGRGA